MNKKEIFKRIIIEGTNRKVSLTPRKLKLPVDIDSVVSLYGPRRCGKTYLFYQTIQDLSSKDIPLEKILYVNFEDERILPFNKEDWEILLDAFYELYPENIDQKNYLFLDEVQEAPLWEKFARRLSEKKNFHIYITGSSSRFFSREISTSLRGRTLSFFLMPFSFREFLTFKDFKIQEHLEYSPLRHKARKLFDEYLKYGGFPEILDKEEFLKMQILQGYYDLIFYKDIVERYKIRNLALMKNLMRYLLTQFSSLFSVTAYYNHLHSSGQKVGKDTLFEYLSLLEEASFVKLVPLFDYSLKKQTVNPRKLYCIDTGLISAGSFQFTENRGKYLENIAFLELLRRDKTVFYFKDKQGYEVDFLVTKKNKPEQLIQVSSELGDVKTKEREIRALISAADQFKIKQCIILTDDQREEIVRGRLKIKVMPLWQWLISEEVHLYQ